MKRLAVVAFLAVLSAASPAPSQEPHLEFVRNLRKNNYPDLALDYLTRLSKNPPASIAKQLPLELARTRLALATSTADLDDRLELYKQARIELEDFKEKNPALASGVEMDIARVLVQQGRTQLSRALSEESVASQQAEADKARKMLAEGVSRLAVVRESLKKQISNLEPKNEDEKRQKRELEETHQLCQMEEAQAWLDQLRTYIKSTEAADLAKVVAAKKGTELMTDVARSELKNGLCWEAEAWLIFCYLNRGEAGDAAKKYTFITSDKTPQSFHGRRLARYFILEVYATENLPPGVLPPNTKAPDAIRNGAQQWVKDYPGYLKTYEGYGVQFKLAESLRALAATQSGKTKEETLAEVKLRCRNVEQGESEWTTRARQMKLAVMFEEKAFDKKIDSLNTFDDCFVRAQYEASQVEGEVKEFQDKDVKKLEAEIAKLEEQVQSLGNKPAEKEAKEKEIKAKQDEIRNKPDQIKRTRMNNTVVALQRALSLADRAPKPPPKDVLSARVSLAYSLMTRGQRDDLVKAIEEGEKLARIATRPPEAAKGAIFALQGMSQILSEGERGGHSAEDVKKYREKFLDLSKFMTESWPADAPGDVARHQIGLLHLREANYPLAVKELSGIKPGYPGAIHAQYQLAMAALEADKNGDKTAEGDPDNRPFADRALEALEKLPDLSDTADEGTNLTYLLAKSRLGGILFRNKKFDELEAMAGPLKDRASKLRLPNDGNKDWKDEMTTGFGTMVLLAKFGKADLAFKAGKLPEVHQLLDPVVKNAADGKAVELADNAPLRNAMFSLALRAAIQDNQLEKANNVITAISKSSGAEGSDVNTLLLLSQLINEQMKELRKKSQPELVAKTQGTFTKLLDGMLETIKKGGKALTLPQAYALAKSYASLGGNKQATELLEGVAKPDEPDGQAIGQYWLVRVELARLYRLQQKFEEAEKEIQSLVGTDKNPGPSAKNIEARKEVIYLLQEKDKKYAPAAVEWDKLIKAIVPNINQPGYKEHYFECYYNLVYCVTMTATNNTNPATKAKQFKQASDFMMGLLKQYADMGGDQWLLKYLDLLQTTPELKTAFTDGHLVATNNAFNGAVKEKDEGVRAKGYRTAANLLIGLEKLYPDFGGADGKAKYQGLLDATKQNEEFKKEYESLK